MKRTKQKKFPEEYNTNVLKIKDTLENLTGEELLEVFPFEQDRTEKKYYNSSNIRKWTKIRYISTIKI